MEAFPLLQFVLGRAGSGKTEYLRELLAEKNRQGGEKLMMLVPEQYSFETEKAILHKAGPVRAASIQAVSYTHLSGRVSPIFKAPYPPMESPQRYVSSLQQEIGSSLLIFSGSS